MLADHIGLLAETVDAELDGKAEARQVDGRLVRDSNRGDGRAVALGPRQVDRAVGNHTHLVQQLAVGILASLEDGQREAVVHRGVGLVVGHAVVDPSVTDDEVIAGFQLLARSEGIIPALECAHAVAWITKESPKIQGQTVLMNLSGRGDKDVAQMMSILGESLG